MAVEHESTKARSLTRKWPQAHSPGRMSPHVSEHPPSLLTQREGPQRLAPSIHLHTVCRQGLAETRGPTHHTCSLWGVQEGRQERGIEVSLKTGESKPRSSQKEGGRRLLWLHSQGLGSGPSPSTDRHSPGLGFPSPGPHHNPQLPGPITAIFRCSILAQGCWSTHLC